MFDLKVAQNFWTNFCGENSPFPIFFPFKQTNNEKNCKFDQQLLSNILKCTSRQFILFGQIMNSKFIQLQLVKFQFTLLHVWTIILPTFVKFLPLQIFGLLLGDICDTFWSHCSRVRSVPPHVRARFGLQQLFLIIINKHSS